MNTYIYIYIYTVKESNNENRQGLGFQRNSDSLQETGTVSMKLGLVFRNLHSVSYETERNFQETEFRMFMKACTVVQETRYRFQEIRHV